MDLKKNIVNLKKNIMDLKKNMDLSTKYDGRQKYDEPRKKIIILYFF